MDISQKRGILFTSIGSCCFLFTIYCFFPGYMSPDSVMYMYQAQIGEYSNWQPPMYGYSWSLLRVILEGPGIMLILQNLFFWGGITLLVYTFSQNSLKHSIFIPLAGFYPAILAQLSTVWKDVLLSSALVCAIALLKYADKKEKKPFLWLSLLGLLYAILLRHNSILAVLPIFLWWSAVFIKVYRLSYSKIKLCIITLITSVVSIVGGYAVNTVNVTKQYPEQQIYMYDLVGLSSRKNINYLPEGMIPHFSLQDLKAVYTKYGANEIYFADFDPKQLPVPPGKEYIPQNPNKNPKRLPRLTKKDYVNELRKSWLKAVFENGSTYLNHRISIFSSLLGSNGEEVCYPFHDRIDFNTIFEYHGWNRLNQYVMSGLYYLKNSLIFRGWVYLGALCALLFWYLKRKQLPEVCIAGGAIWYIVAYFFVTASCEFRFLYWPVMAVVILLLLLGAENQNLKSDTTFENR